MKLYEEFKLYENMWDDESVNTDKPYKLSCTNSDLDDAITLNKVPTYLKNVKEVELVDRDRVPVKKYNQICKMLAGLGIKVTKGASGRERAEVVAKSITEDWYGADAEVEFETSVYPDIAKYFGLKDDEVVTYAYYYTDEVIVNYDDAQGRSHEIEKHVPLDQVEEWFKAGYTILDEAKSLTEAEDPYGYGPYKTFSDPTLSVGDYVLAPRSFSSDKKTYPARITSVTRDWIKYTISGFGFVDEGTKARPGSSAARGLNNLKRYLNKK